MKDYMQFILVIILALNVSVLILFGLDKAFAIRHKRRIPEAVLLWLCFLAGSGGGLLGMLLFRHKTNARRHPAFAFGVPAMLLLHLTAAWLLLR